MRWKPHDQPGTSGLKGLTWWLKNNNNNNIKPPSDDMLYPTDWDEINWLFLKRLCWKFKWFKCTMFLKKGCRKQGENFLSKQVEQCKKFVEINVNFMLQGKKKFKIKNVFAAHCKHGSRYPAKESKPLYLTCHNDRRK